MSEVYWQHVSRSFAFQSVGVLVGFSVCFGVQVIGEAVDDSTFGVVVFRVYVFVGNVNRHTVVDGIRFSSRLWWLHNNTDDSTLTKQIGAELRNDAC